MQEVYLTCIFLPTWMPTNAPAIKKAMLNTFSDPADCPVRSFVVPEYQHNKAKKKTERADALSVFLVRVSRFELEAS
jgi:hypothetical protein